MLEFLFCQRPRASRNNKKDIFPGWMIFVVTKSPSELAALTNCVFVNPTDWNDSRVKYLCIKKDYVLSVKYAYLNL